MRGSAGRAMVFAVVAVLLMSAVGFAATKTFINKTGKTVTGITITFSKDVRITRHDSAFSDQSPSGRSDEFTFDGGELRNSGRFTVSWMPSSGKVTNYEWIKKAQLAQATQGPSRSDEQEFKLPDPNTPPILYGDDYPGPDEPLYQPQPDEQIWLTDLDEHGDIYDNDSIKINYAPGFDVSQITKINVYRNGIKLRFVPQKFDVLTNAQMKTFDGNPAEHSPASNHTDHAIMGYEYKFKILSADHVWILKKTVKSGFRWRPKEVWVELDISWYWQNIDFVSHEEIVDFLKYLKADGITGISADVVYYVNTPHDNDVLAVYDPDSPIVNFDIVTPTSSELEKMLRAAEEVGLETHIRTRHNIGQEYQDANGRIYGGAIEPSNPALFFENYASLLLKLVPLLNQYHVRLFTILVEADRLEANYPNLISKLLSQVAAKFDGEMGIDQATNNMLSGHSYLSPRGTFLDLAPSFTFWGWRDPSGQPVRIEYSCHNTPQETQKDQRASIMPERFVKFWRTATEYYRKHYPNNIQMFGEIGVRLGDGSLSNPNYWNTEANTFDFQEGADGRYSQLKGSMELGIDRFNIWEVSLADRWLWLDTHSCKFMTGFGHPEYPVYRIIKAIIKPKE